MDTFAEIVHVPGRGRFVTVSLNPKLGADYLTEFSFIPISHLLPAIKKIPGTSLISKNPAPTKGLTSLLLSLGKGAVGMLQSYLASKKTFSHLLKRCLQYKSGKTGRWGGMNWEIGIDT